MGYKYNRDGLCHAQLSLFLVLSNHASLAIDKKDDEIEIKTGGGRLAIVLSIFIWVVNISDWQWNRVGDRIEKKTDRKKTDKCFV